LPATTFEEENCKVRSGGTAAVIISSYGMPSVQKAERRSNLLILRQKSSEGKIYYVYMTAGMNKFLRIYYACVKEAQILWMRA
jgi:hypothetical protein